MTDSKSGYVRGLAMPVSHVICVVIEEATPFSEIRRSWEHFRVSLDFHYEILI